MSGTVLACPNRAQPVQHGGPHPTVLAVPKRHTARSTVGEVRTVLGTVLLDVGRLVVDTPEALRHMRHDSGTARRAVELLDPREPSPVVPRLLSATSVRDPDPMVAQAAIVALTPRERQ